VPERWYRPGHHNRPEAFAQGSKTAPVVTGLNDQHTHVQLDPSSPLRVGDMIGFGVSHPCTTFDKWPMIYVVDDDYAITGAIRTYF